MHCLWPEKIRQIAVANIAHRGASAHAPENTLRALELAFELGAHAVEFDVQLTRDAAPVIVHDERVDRTTDGAGRVGDLTLNEIRKLDAGAWFGEEFAGLGVPKLVEAVNAVPEDGLVNVEIKSRSGDEGSIEEAVLEVLDVPGIGERVVISSYDVETIRRLGDRSRICGTSLRVRSLPGGELDMDTLAGVCLCVNLEVKVVTPAVVNQLHGAGFVVETYTVNDEVEMGRLIDAGVDAIFTDRPDLLTRILSERVHGGAGSRTHE